MLYADAHVEFIHHPTDLADLPDPHFAIRQINPDLINRIKPELLFLACFVEPGPNGWSKLKWIINEYRKTITQNGWLLVKNKLDLNQAGIKILLHVEDLAAIKKDLTKIKQLHRLGVRSIGLTHNPANQFAGGSLSNQGLTELGQQAINEIINNQIWLDFAHLNERSFIEITKAFPRLKPFVSHGGLKGVHNQPRNISDKILKIIAQKDGWLGVGCARSFLTDQKTCNRQDYLKQLSYAAEIVGEQRVGLGSDLGGIISGTPVDLRNIADLISLNSELPTPIMGANLINFLTRNWRS